MAKAIPSQLKCVSYDAAQLDDDGQRALSIFQRATALGFYEELPDEAGESTYVRLAAAQKLRFTMVFDQQAPAESRHASQPVHTYASFPGLLNAGGARPVAVHKITAVTVSPTHRRQGILTRQITEDLNYARRGGFALAVLTASEASIYGRYGFEPATYQTRFTLKCEGGLKLLVALPGTVIDVDPEPFATKLEALMRSALAQTFGSVDGTEFDVGYALGRWEGWDSLAKAKNMRHAAYYDEAGELGGSITYKFGGWDDAQPKMVVHKLVALSDVARLKLLEYVANHDLVQQVHGQGALDDPMRLVLHNVRDYQVRSTDDVLWLRVLDVIAAFEARGYQRSGQLVISVTDRLSLIDGTYLFEVADGSATVKRVAIDAEELTGVAHVVLGERELAGLYLGTVQLSQLLAAGRASTKSESDVSASLRLFEVDRAPFTPHTF